MKKESEAVFELIATIFQCSSIYILDLDGLKLDTDLLSIVTGKSINNFPNVLFSA